MRGEGKESKQRAHGQHAVHNFQKGSIKWRGCRMSARPLCCHSPSPPLLPLQALLPPPAPPAPNPPAAPPPNPPHLQEPLHAPAAVLGALPVIAVRQQHHQPGLAQPLGLATAQELVKDDLGGGGGEGALLVFPKPDPHLPWCP